MFYMRNKLILIALLAAVGCQQLPLAEYIDPQAEWTLILESTTGKRERLTLHNSDGTVQPVKKGNAYFYEGVGGKKIDLSIAYAASPSLKGALEITPKLVNNEEGWVILAFEGPVLKGIPASGEDAFILPVGTGWRLPLKAISAAPAKGEKPQKPWSWDKKEQVYTMMRPYPSRNFTMQWGVLQGKDGGVYFASHDPAFRWKDVFATYKPSTGEAALHFKNHVTCFAGETAELPSTLVYPYKGTWHTAADVYRAWFLPNRKILEKPEWAQHNTGWLLAILKQQNDEVIVPYNEIGTFLTEAAEERGIDVLGLFGRGIGGHDRFYPDYSSDPKLGGHEAFKKGIAQAHEKGKRVVVYTNGQLLDQEGTQFWPDTGKFITVVNEKGELEYQKWHKYADAPARIHGMACQRSQVWRDIMLRLAKDANALGADGLLYDQLATRGPMYCYCPDHGHTVPAIVYENDRNDNMAYVQAEMAKINPDFIVMTEGLVDAEMNAIGMFHGCGEAAGIHPEAAFLERFTDEGSIQYYPEIFRYTFPELVTTVRHPNPAQTRYSLNYGLAFGFRNEMEVRYAADRRYVEDGVIPVKEDYGNVLSAPNLQYLVNAGDPAAARTYYKQVLSFQKEHADLLMDGRFLAGKGVELKASSPCVLAHAYQAGDRLGVLVWNASAEAVSYTVSVPGYKQAGVCAPDCDVAPGDNLAPRSIHLVLFEK